MSNRRSALGRGLGALISNPSTAPTPRLGDAARAESAAAPDTSVTPADAGPPEIEIDLIDPNPEQPRRVFDPNQLDRLAASIAQHGVLQPVVVRRAGERFELIVGERRWRASRKAGLAKIPAVVADIATRDRLEIAIVENVQRHDLNPMELAHAYQALAKGGATQEEIGQKVSMDRSSVANHLRLLELSRDIQQDVEEGRLSMGHAKALLQVSNPERRLHLRDRVIREGLPVRATEQLGRQIAGPAPARRPRKPKSGGTLDPAWEPLVEQLQRHLQAKVRLSGDGTRGQIEIDYSSTEDLERLCQMLLGDAG